MATLAAHNSFRYKQFGISSRALLCAAVENLLRNALSQHAGGAAESAGTKAAKTQLFGDSS
jgi:hypothetical protein